MLFVCLFHISQISYIKTLNVILQIKFNRKINQVIFKMIKTCIYKLNSCSLLCHIDIKYIVMCISDYRWGLDW
jgi:hypothetical protein